MRAAAACRFYSHPPFRRGVAAALLNHHGHEALAQAFSPCAAVWAFYPPSQDASLRPLFGHWSHRLSVSIADDNRNEKGFVPTPPL